MRCAANRDDEYSMAKPRSNPHGTKNCPLSLSLSALQEFCCNGSISLDSRSRIKPPRAEFNALHVGYFAVPPCTTVKVHTGAWPWPSVRARTHTTPPHFADSMHARIGAACRAGIRATTARGKAIFLERASKRIRRSAV